MTQLNTDIEAYNSENFFQKNRKWFLLIFSISIIGIFLAVFVFNYLKTTKSILQRNSQPQQSFQNKGIKPPSFVAPIDELLFINCDLKKVSNPLVSDVRTIKTMVVGTFTGNINKITYEKEKQTASLELISPKGEQSYSFTIKDEEGLVYDAVKLKDLSLNDLQIGQTVVASFNCNPGTENPFRVTRINRTSRQ